MKRITHCLWFDNNAEQAVKFYTQIFKGSIGTTARYDAESAKVSGRPEGSVLTITFKILGQDFMALNGGPIFKFSPGISLFVHCKTKSEVDTLFKKLSKGGEIMMALDKYPFSERYAFFKDKFGMSWQLMLSKKSGIALSLLFVGDNLGKAKPAVDFYNKVFKNSKIDSMTIYGKNQGGKEGTVMHCSFHIGDQEFMAMDGAGPHKFTFTPAISFIVNCDTQKELDYYWKMLSAVPQAEQCGWLQDKFGISWQITPAILEKLMKNPKKGRNVMKALLGMKKLDIKKLQDAYNK
jgi:predicted 3-demethylubiquinone-9 3-methyltransferase (glyoxalase superfamily)